MPSDDLTLDLINSLTYELNETSSTIEELYIGNIVKEEISDSLPKTFEKINVDNMIASGEYDGSGINVGIVEASAVKGGNGGVIDVSTYGKNQPGYKLLRTCR